MTTSLPTDHPHEVAGQTPRMLFGRIETQVDTVLAAYASLLALVPAGLTVVGTDGQVVYLNGYQATLFGCPWCETPSPNMHRDSAVPQSIRTGLRRIAANGVLAPFRAGPIVFTSGGLTLDTWLVPVLQAETCVAAVVLQYPREAERVRQGSTPVVPERPDATVTPPTLDVALLMETFGLTQREIQVIDALCRGEGTPAIATAMGISPNTVKDYVKRVQRKMGVRNRLTIVSRALHVSLR